MANFDVTAGTGVTLKTTDNAGVHTPHKNIDAVIPGTGATNLGKAEDAAHTTGDVGVMALTVRADTPAATGANGDYVPLLTDASGRLYVMVDVAAGTIAKAEDAAHVSGDVGVMSLAVRADTAAATGSNGDYVPLIVNSVGALHTAQVASELHLGQTGEPADVITVTPTVSATPDYTAGDAVGGKQTLTSAARVSGGKVELQSLVVIDLSNQKKDLTILFFKSDPSAATITDNDAFAFSTDIAKVVGKVNVADTDYESVDSKAVATLRNIGLEMKCDGSANLYAAVIAGEAINLASTGDYTFIYGFKQS